MIRLFVMFVIATLVAPGVATARNTGPLQRPAEVTARAADGKSALDGTHA